MTSIISRACRRRSSTACQPFPYDFRVTEILREHGGGLLMGTPGQFVAAVERLAPHGSELRTLCEAAPSAGQALDWDTLAARYGREVFDVYLS